MGVEHPPRPFSSAPEIRNGDMIRVATATMTTTAAATTIPTSTVITRWDTGLLLSMEYPTHTDGGRETPTAAHQPMSRM